MRIAWLQSLRHPSSFVKVTRIARLVHNLLPLLLALILLSTQQAGMTHILGHILVDQTQHDKQRSHSLACEQCAVYAQLGSALNNTGCFFVAITLPAVALPHNSIAFRSTQILAAIARGPPLQKIA